MSPSPDFPRPFLIVAGDAALQRSNDAFPPLFRLLSEALEGFSGTVIAGGTAVGVAGVLGDIRALGFHSFKLVGVRPFATRPLYPDHPQYGLMLDTGAATGLVTSTSAAPRSASSDGAVSIKSFACTLLVMSLGSWWRGIAPYVWALLQSC